MPQPAKRPTRSRKTLVGHTFEVDKMSAEHSRYNWENVLGPIKENLGEYVGKTLKSISIDSYESDIQNWTPTFREEFIKRKGYDPVPWLVTLVSPLGIITGSLIQPDTSASRSPLSRPGTGAGQRRGDQAFRVGLPRCDQRPFFDNGWKVARKMCNDAGLEFWHECYEGRSTGIKASPPRTSRWLSFGRKRAM